MTLNCLRGDISERRYNNNQYKVSGRKLVSNNEGQANVIVKNKNKIVDMELGISLSCSVWNTFVVKSADDQKFW